MDSGCYMGVGLLMGVLIGAFFAYGNARWQNAMRKIDAIKSEKTKADGIMVKAQQRRSQGYDELPGALLFMVMALVLLILMAYVLAAVAGLF